MQRDEAVFASGARFEDRYDIVIKLGEGGFGTVHKARQLSTGQLLALKILRLPDGQVVQGSARVARFLRETRLCAQLHHPNLVQLVDSGQTADGTLYIAFAFAPGDNLAALLEREGALAPREARHLMLQVLDALACAHAEGVVHRDLKPTNIMVVPTGARRNALVLDFGIGAMIDDERSTRLTGSHEGLGTPGYGAPEQWRGAEPSPRADLFSWGLVFLECLTGKPAYAGTPADMFYHLLGPDPVPMPAALAHHPVGEVLARALAKDAAARDVTARGLLEALEACDLRGLSREARLGAGDDRRPWSTGPTVVLSGAQPPAPGGERRQLTALCCHVTVQAGEAQVGDGDALDDLLREALASCADAGRRHGGFVAGALGDQLLVYFGYPSAAEDDARRAARAALAMAVAVRARDEPGARIEVSVGVHTGLVVDGDLADLHGAWLITGATPRLAARLAALGPPGSVTVSSASQRLLRTAFDVEPDAVHTLDGIAGPVATFRLWKEQRHAARPTPEAPKTPISGRDPELGLLVERWHRAGAGAGQASLIIGEPGIGKSRLARALRDRVAHEPNTFLEARCSPDAQNSALAPVVELLERALGLDQDPDPGRKTARLERELAGHGLTLADAMPLFLPLFSLPLGAPYAAVDVSPPRQKLLTLQAIGSLVFAMADQRPVLMLVEDLHWADPTTMELLTQLVRAVPEAPVCLLMTARPEFSPPFSTAGTLLLPLSRLDRPHIQDMLTALVHHKAVPPAVVEQIADRADGVPLFVEELLRMMLDAGLLVERDDRYELTGSLSGAAIPATLRALLTARLDRLSRARETAQLAAALGREFSIDVLSAASPLGPAGVALDLEQLMAAGLVQRRRRGKDAVGVFKHALVRDAAYESLSTGGRQRVHARIADTLERQFPAIAAARPDLLAQHHAAAAQHEAAVAHGMRATQLAAALSQNDEAIAHGSFVLEHIAKRPAELRVDLELSLNGVVTPVLMARYGWGDERVKAKVERSRQLLGEVGDSEHRFPTLCSLTFYHHVAGNRRDARTLAQELLETAILDRDVGRQVLARTLLGQCRWIDGDYVAGEQLLASALELYDPDSHGEHGLTLGLDTRVWATAALAQVRWFTGDTVAARDCIRDAIAWAEELKIVPSRGIAYFYDALICQYAGDKRGTAAAATKVITLAETYGLPAFEGYCRFLRFWAEDDAESAAPIPAMMEQMGCRLALDYYASLSAQTLMERGEFASALQRLEVCLAMCAPLDEHYYEPELHLRAAICKLHMAADHRESARASLREAIRIARRQGMYKTEIDTLVEEVRHFGPSEDQRQRIAEIAALRPHALEGDRLAFALSLGITS